MFDKELQLPHLLKSESDLKSFRETLLSPLPICFRLNSTISNSHLIKKRIDEFTKMKVKELIPKTLESNNAEETQEIEKAAVVNVDWVF